MKMIHTKKKLGIYLSVLLMLILPFVTQAQMTPLPRECRFKIGDDLQWAAPAFNDGDWDFKPLGTSWAAKDMKENVYAWYRIKMIIPSAMKALAEKGKGLKLNLGKIDDIDQTFFNGKLIGQTGSFPPDYIGKWDTERLYTIPVNYVQWDKENLLAVRIFSPDIGGVGMYQGAYNYGPVQWSDFTTVTQEITETKNNGFTTQLKFTNNADIAFNGTIKYWINDKNNKPVFVETKPIQVKPEKGYEATISFANYQPVNEDIFKVGYLVQEEGSTAIVKNEQLYLANRKIEIKVAEEPKTVVENKIKDAFTSIEFKDQQQQGYLGKRMNQNLVERLLKVDEPGILDGYLQRPGHHPWAGEHIGKYLEAACNVWKNTHNAQLKMQMDRLMYQLVNSQMPDGYLGTYIPDEYWTSWDVWSHKYNLYGLLAYYTTTGYKPALEACKKMGDLLCKTFGNKPGQRDIIKAGTHMGMAATSVLDPMVELYKYTGDKKYLNFCYYILDAWEQPNGPKIISALLATGKVTKVGNGKAYEMLSNFVGLANLYRVTGDERLLKPVLIAWNDILTNRLYITGTTSSFEYFQDDEKLPAEEKDHIGEGCVTVTWIQFNRQLLAITGDLKYMEQIEKSIYNHLLAAENPETGCVSYYTPLMGIKPFTCYITCCQSSVPRGIAMIPNFTFGNIKNVPTLMMYEPASYKENIITPGKKNITLELKVESSFPESGNAVVTVNTSQAASFPISLRVPSWCNSFIATISGKVYKGSINESLIINRNWKPGEKIKIAFDIPVKILSGGKSYPAQLAFQRGPQLLAMDSLLNIDVLKIFKLEPENKLLVEKPTGKTGISILPNQWIGKQIYTINIVDTKPNSKKQQLVLVPFADASQTGGAMKVWMPLSIKQ